VSKYWALSLESRQNSLLRVSKAAAFADREMDTLNFRIDDSILDQTRKHCYSVLDGSLGEDLRSEYRQLSDDSGQFSVH
jgi:hypothetical protein